MPLYYETLPFALSSLGFKSSVYRELIDIYIFYFYITVIFIINVT